MRILHTMLRVGDLQRSTVIELPELLGEGTIRLVSYLPELTLAERVKADRMPYDRWHAMGAIKKFGYSILDRGEGSSSLIAQAMAMHRNYDVALASAPAAVPYFAEAFNASSTIMRVAPLPRTDLLTDPAHLTAKRAELLARYPHLATGKNILFAPTFHKGQSFDAAELTQFFAARGFNFIAKAHPVALSADAPDQYAQASAFDLLAVADFVVTDYSSIMIEAAIADIPVFVLAPDLAGQPWLKQGFDKLLLDPARAGAIEVLKQLPLKGLKKIVYVSCHPGSLARDAGWLVNEAGWTLREAGVMDMFPHTAHVESIAVFEPPKKN